jgi:hypothetical protein
MSRKAVRGLRLCLRAVERCEFTSGRRLVPLLVRSLPAAGQLGVSRLQIDDQGLEPLDHPGLLGNQVRKIVVPQTTLVRPADRPTNEPRPGRTGT